MCALGCTVAIYVNLNTHKFKDAYRRAINTLAQVSPGVGSGTGKVFLACRSPAAVAPLQTLWVPRKALPFQKGISRAGSLGMPRLQCFLGQQPRAQDHGKGEGKAQGIATHGTPPAFGPASSRNLPRWTLPC